MNTKSVVFGRTILRGIGQIMLQENAWTGALFLAGIFYGSVIMGIGALLAAITGTLTAKLLKYDENHIEMGLYGFSATLVGVAVTFYFAPSLIIWIAIIAGAALAAILQHFFITKRIPGFTFPFILITWILLYLFHHVYPIASSTNLGDIVADADDFATSTHGFGEVVFQGSAIAGIIFFIAVFISKPVAALYGIVAALLSASISLLFAEPSVDIHMGLFSFNAVLCAITFAGDRPRDGLYVLFSVVLTVLIDVLMLNLNCSVLTFPFVAASCVTLAIRHFLPASLK